MILSISHPLIRQSFIEYRTLRVAGQAFGLADFSKKYKLKQIIDEKDSIVGFEISEAHYNWLNLRFSK